MTRVLTRCTVCGSETMQIPPWVSDEVRHRDRETGEIGHGAPQSVLQFSDGAFGVTCAEHERDEAVTSQKLLVGAGLLQELPI